MEEMTSPSALSPTMEPVLETKTLATATADSATNDERSVEEPPKLNGTSNHGRPLGGASPTSAFLPDPIAEDTSNSSAREAPQQQQQHQPQQQPPQQGFRMQMNVHKLTTHRKRKRDGRPNPLTAGASGGGLNVNMALSSSSSSSSDEEEQDVKRSANSGSMAPQSELKLSPHQGFHMNGDSTGNVHPKIRSQDMPGRDSNSTKDGPGSRPMSKEGMANGPSLSLSNSTHQPDGWRVKLYRLNADGSWDDCGTGRIMCLYKKGVNAMNGANGNKLGGESVTYFELGEPTLCMHAELNNNPISPTQPRILLRTRILLRDAYQRQGDTIITWCEPYLEEGNPAQGVDLALSFQDNVGCLDIWRQITQVQSKAAELFRLHGGGGQPPPQSNGLNAPNLSVGVNGDVSTGDKGNGSVEDIANAVAAAHHATLQRQQQQEMWVNVASEASQHHVMHQNQMPNQGHEQLFEESDMVAYDDNMMGTQPAMNAAPMPQLPNPPTIQHLEEIADTIASVQHLSHAESLVIYIAQNECSYLKSLLSLFPSAESRGDYSSLATLAACVKTILLLNDPSIIELIVTDELIFEEVCATLEYDPDLRDKANHRWFLRERVKFRTVVLMEDEELIAAIHRSFRVNYLRDTLLRPTMDESSLSTLSSLQTFTHSDVVKGVTMSPGTDDKGELLKGSYLAKVIRVLGRELEAICEMEWKEVEGLPEGASEVPPSPSDDSMQDASTVVATGKYPQGQRMSTTWKQHLAPQDQSLSSRRQRRRGSLTFLRELFNMVRTSLQQSDKDDFFAVLVSMEVDLNYDDRPKSLNGNKVSMENDGGVSTDNASQSMPKPVNLLSLLGTVLADPNIDATEKGFALEIVSGIAMHDPILIRRRCLDFYNIWKAESTTAQKYFDHLGPVRPYPNEKRQIIFHCPPNDILGAMVFLKAVETDAGVLLQVAEIMRIILDTDMMGDHGPMGAGFTDEAEGIPVGHNLPQEQHINHQTNMAMSNDQNQFLSMFYDHYVQWLTAPFQYKILHPARRIPVEVIKSQSESHLLRDMLHRFEHGHSQEEPLLTAIPPSSTRSSFAVELVSFCVRAHLYRMKCYILRSGVLGNMLKFLRPLTKTADTSGDRCLKLSVLRFFRAVLSINDEFYHRHIIQHDLFAPVFEAFRENPVGDNLVSSSIVEMCDFIRSDNIKSLVEYIVVKHMTPNPENEVPSLESISSPYVGTFGLLRQLYENNKNGQGDTQMQNANPATAEEGGNQPPSSYFHHNAANHVVLNEKALEDQRKFREADQESSYFDSDEDDPPSPNSNAVPTTGREIGLADGMSPLHRAPRIFALVQPPRLNGTMPPNSFEEPASASNPGTMLPKTILKNEAMTATTTDGVGTPGLSGGSLS